MGVVRERAGAFSNASKSDHSPQYSAATDRFEVAKRELRRKDDAVPGRQKRRSENHRPVREIGSARAVREGERTDKWGENEGRKTRLMINCELR